MKNYFAACFLFLTLTMGVQAQTARKFTIYLHADSSANVVCFLPQTPSGKAIVGVPGGGYSVLSNTHEGTMWSDWLNQRGIAYFVVNYRLPNGDRTLPMSDVQNTIRMVRDSALVWQVNPHDVGIMGFSAGGHLASTIATQSTGDAKPNFQILFYPVITMMEGYGHEGSFHNFLGDNDGKKYQKRYSSDMHVTRVTPRAFIALSDDDSVVPPANGVNYYMELYRNDVRASLHVYPSGGHGWGSNLKFKYHDEMMLDFKAWLRSF